MEATAVIRFNYACSQDELSALALDFAENVKPAIDGLIWKIFLNEPEKHRSGGLYLFRNMASALAYTKGPYVDGLRTMPGVSNVLVEVFEVMAAPSIEAGAPVQAGVA
jgi:hypothetical protein